MHHEALKAGLATTVSYACGAAVKFFGALEGSTRGSAGAHRQPNS